MSVKDIFLEAILHETADAIIFLDPDEVIRYWNRGAEEVYGYFAEEVLGKHYSFLIPPPNRKQEILEIRRLMAEKGSLRHYETQRLRKDGKIIYVELTWTLLRDVRGNLLGTSAVVRDITQKRQMQEELANMERLSAMARVAGKVAHELRTPLGVFALKSDLLEEEIESLMAQLHGERFDGIKDKVRRYFRELEEQTRRLNDIIEDYLSLSKVRTPQLESVNLVAYLQEWVEEMNDRSDAKFVPIEYEPAVSQAQVLVDPEQFRRVLQNLYNNSLDAVKEDGLIRIRLGCENDRYRVWFVDNGTGISPEMLERLFSPFETTKRSGTGLGLYLVREILQAHGGEVEIQSEVEQGTEVLISLPRHSTTDQTEIE